jgi:hypothetical protein
MSAFQEASYGGKTFDKETPLILCYLIPGTEGKKERIYVQLLAGRRGDEDRCLTFSLRHCVYLFTLSPHDEEKFESW